MKLFNKCWMGHNGVVGITLKVLLLLFATKVTYATSYIGSSDPNLQSYMLYPVHSIEVALAGAVEDESRDLTSPIPASQGTPPFLSKVCTDELDKLADPETLRAAGIQYVAYDSTDHRGIRCLRHDRGIHCKAFK